MTEDTSKSGVPDTIYREALGRIARLGDLYDAAADKFCGMSMLKENLPPDSQAISTTDSHHSKISTSITNSVSDKLEILDVTAELKLSVLAGLVQLEGSAKYLNEKKKSFKSAECVLVCNTATVVEQLNLFNEEEVKNRISMDALLHKTATHFVAKIYWGANCTINVTDQNYEGGEKTKVEGMLKAHMEKLKAFSITGKAELDLTEQEKSKWRSFSVNVFGDILPDSTDKLPVDFNGAVQMIRDLPKLLQKSNNGKGKPLTYVMLSLSSEAVKSYLADQRLTAPVLRKIDESRISQVVGVCDYLSRLVQEARDHVDEMTANRYCVTDSERKEAHFILESLALQEDNVTTDLQKVIEAVRTGDRDAASLADFCKERYAAAEEIAEKCKKIYNAILPRIQFMKRCERYDVKCLTPPVEEQIAGACDKHDNVYVLFDGEADRETTQRNHSALIELAKCKQEDNGSVFFVVWLDQNQRVRIERYRKGKLLHADVAKEMETNDMAACIEKVTRASNLETFRARCPGSFESDGCSREERSWTCLNCNETLQFCPDDCLLYCSCGKARPSQFQFRCRSISHGSDFTPCSDEIRARNYQSLADRAFVVRCLKTVHPVGLTVVDDKLFVLGSHSDPESKVVVCGYSVHNYRYQTSFLRGEFDLHNSDDLTSCVLHRCLYASSFNNRCVYKCDLAKSSASKWAEVPGNPCGLSVTQECNLLVTCREPSKLVELSADNGQRVREITLQSDVPWPWHGVQLTTGQYVVCHGHGQSLNRVCIVGDNGRVTRSFGGQHGSGVGQLKGPRQLAVDKDSQLIFVADEFNQRVVLLSPTLERVGEISMGVQSPNRLYLHQATRRLFASQWEKEVFVIQL